jgi:hypothetical protein
MQQIQIRMPKSDASLYFCISHSRLRQRRNGLAVPPGGRRGQHFLQRGLDIAKSIERVEINAAFPAMRQKVPLGEHYVGDLNGITVGHAISYEDDGLPAFTKAADQGGFASRAPVRAGFPYMRKRGKQPALLHPECAREEI